MNIREGMWVKLPPENNCGCYLCDKAEKSFHKVKKIRRATETVELEGIVGAFPLEVVWKVKRTYMENK